MRATKREEVHQAGGEVPEMDRETFIGLLKDWRVALLIILVVLSLVAIYPHFEDGHLVTRIQYGLDLEGGSWTQLEFSAETVTFVSDKPVDELVTALRDRLDAEVYLVAEGMIEIRKAVPEEELRTIFAEEGATLSDYYPGIMKDTAEQAKITLEEKINSLGTKDAKVYTITGLNGICRYMRIELAGVSLGEALEIVGKPGKFEIRVHTIGNETEHVLFGDMVSSVQNPQMEHGGMWGVPFALSEAGAVQFQQAAITYGATKDPDNHYLDMILDGTVVYSAPLSPSLAGDLQANPTRSMRASTGMGEEGREEARMLEIHLRAGALPVDVSIAGAGSVSSTLGDHFKFFCVLAGIFALLAVAVLIFIRYREPAIVLPMISINFSEIIILLGIATFIQQLDLASIAGLIAVLGTGIDQLVIITDEILHEGKVPSPNLYLKRLTRALGIIMASAATVVIAMLPLAVMDLSSLRGFAIITILGVIIGVVVTRPAYGRIIMAILSK